MSACPLACRPPPDPAPRRVARTSMKGASLHEIPTKFRIERSQGRNVDVGHAVATKISYADESSEVPHLFGRFR
jgi:hypothetical protein